MPLHWTIDSRLQLFVAACDGNIEPTEVNQMLDAIVGANGLVFRKLQNADVEHGPLAIAVPDDKYMLLSRVLGILAAARRPMRVFKDADRARKWLDSPAIRGPA